jgi:hypothetical protein
VDIDLDTLKSEILQYLEAAGFAVFRSHPGELEGMPLVCWDCERFPDYRMFLETAQKVNARLILFAAREFEASELEEEVEALEDCELTREDRREYERRLRDYRKHVGVTCSLELGFDHNSRLYVYEVRPDWYDEFLELSDDIATNLPSPGGDDEADGSGMGGFYSNN